MEEIKKMEIQLYPLLFEPVYKERIWGGEQLKNTPGRAVPETGLPVGEAWEICDRKDLSSIVENGVLKGKDLHYVLKNHRAALLGSAAGYVMDDGEEYFPLLVKLIDAASRLSLQVHPSAEHCRILGKGEEKNELWYVIRSEKDARIFAGLSPMVTKTQFMDALEGGDGELEELLQSFDAAAGDAYFIYAGRLHAIGAGVLLLEIQQNSDTTYRVSDWGRTCADGSKRELHIKESMTCIDFTERTVARITGASDSSFHNRKYTILDKCGYFQVTDLKLVEEIHGNTESSSSFHLLSAIDHDVRVETSAGSTLVPASRTCLIPACTGRYRIVPLVKAGECADVILTTR
ncbi:MAG: class I mannose-6-phosphate isomerase [Lentisphaeria bacterium]|nr:class I mannose-6-phosphate isomerase [Lentisphaeria bacterium]